MRVRGNNNLENKTGFGCRVTITVGWGFGEWRGGSGAEAEIESPELGIFLDFFNQNNPFMPYFDKKLLLKNMSLNYATQVCWYGSPMLEP